MSNSALGEDLLRVSETLLMTDSLISVSELDTSEGRKEDVPRFEKKD
jgi:hypothetical protein